MLAVNYSTLRNNLKAYCDKATDESETVIVTRKNEKNETCVDRNRFTVNLCIFVRCTAGTGG